MKYLKTYESLYKSDVMSFLNDFGFFITLNLAKVSSMAKGDTERVELSKMLNKLNSPILNGKKYSEIINDDSMIKNPKVLSGLFSQIKRIIEYIEPRIERYVVNNEIKSKWIEKLDRFKNQYKNLVAQ